MASHRPEVRKHTNQMLLTLATKLSMMALRLIRNIILARVLGVADRGAFAFLVALPELILVLGSGGLQTSATRQGAESSSPGTLILQIASVGLILGLVFAGITFGAFQVPALFRGYYDRIEMFAALVAFVTVVFSVKFLVNQYMTGAGWIGAMNLARFLESLLLFVLMLSFFAFGYTTLADAVSAWALSYLCLAVVISVLVFKFSRGPLKFDTAALKNLFIFGTRGHADIIFQRILLRIDFVFISMMLSAEDLGYYAVAAIGAEALSAIPESVSAPLTRRLLRSGDFSQFKLTMIATRWVIAVVAVCGIIGALLADWAVRTFFGEEFAPAVPALLMLIPAVVAASGSSFLRLALLGRDKPGMVSIIFGFAAVANLVLNWLLIPIYGIVGAAAASTISYIAGFITLYICFTRVSGQRWYELFSVSLDELRLICSFVVKQK